MIKNFTVNIVLLNSTSDITKSGVKCNGVKLA